jgi:hypothetical protein
MEAAGQVGVGAVADDTRNQDLPGGEFHVALDLEFMFVTDAAALRSSTPGVDTEHDVDDVASGKSVVYGLCQLPH